MEEVYHIGLQLKMIADKLRQDGDAAFARYGLTGPQVGYLSYILKFGGSLSQKELEKAAGVSHPTIVGVIGRLQKKGYVEVTTDEKDRRNRIVHLTDKARNVTEQLRKGGQEMDARMLEGMTGEEKQELSRLLNIVDANLRASLQRKECESDEGQSE